MVKLSMTSDLDKTESPSSVTSVIDIVCWGLNKIISGIFILLLQTHILYGQNKENNI